MLRSRFGGACAMAMLLAVAPLAAQTADSARAPRAFAYQVSMRLRPRVSTTSVENGERARWELRRMRLQGRVWLWQRVQSRVQLDYDGGEWALDDAWVQLALLSRLELLLGQAKRPFTVISMRSGSSVGTVARGGSIRGARTTDEQNLVNDLEFGDRAVGVQLGAPLALGAIPLHIQAGVFPDAPFRAPLASGAQASARVTARVARRAVVGAAWSSRMLGASTDADSSADPGRRGSALGVDVEIGDDEPGVHVLAEWVTGATEQPGGRFRGAHAWLMYRTEARGPARLTWEPLLRLSTAGGDLSADAGAGTLVTPGFNLYVGDPERWNRLMVNYDVWVPADGSRRARSLKVQLQVGVG
jgi:hypothetical protein